MVAPAGCYSVMAATVAPVARVVSVVTAPRGGPGEAAATLASRGLTAQTPRQNPMWSAARVVMAARAAAALASAAPAGPAAAGGNGGGRRVLFGNGGNGGNAGAAGMAARRCRWGWR